MSRRKNNIKKIPDLVIPRLSLYHRTLLDYTEADIISSVTLADRIGITAAQVRRDLSYFGQFGTPGKGYRVKELRTSILRILGLDRSWNVALIGVGNLGAAFISYQGFRKQGFKIVCAFDTDSRKIGKVLQGIKVQDISQIQDTIEKKDVKMAIVAVLSDTAQDVVDKLVQANVQAILNFTPFRPQLPDWIQVLNIDLSIELERLAYYLNRN